MAIERERLIEVVVSVGVVAVFVSVIIAIGLRYNQGGFGSDGGIALIAAIVAFVLAMAAVGYALAFMFHSE